jgi:8-oxo-dGTP diphosphatase
MKFEFSAGGIVIKKDKDKEFVLLCQHSGHHGWVFPKGLIGDKKENEGKEETAVREVKEETGVDGKIIKPLTPIEYWYFFEGERIKKTVYYFLMKYISGDISKHDDEMEDVEWLEKEDVEKRLTYPSDKKVWHEVSKLL